MILLNHLPLDIIKLVHNELDFIHQRNLRLVSTEFKKLHITNLLDNVPNVSKLTDKILKLYPFIIKLNAHYNDKISNTNHLLRLTTLDVSGGFCTINVSLLTNLTKLDAGKSPWSRNDRDSGKIENTEFLKLNNLTNLTKLNIFNNLNITGIGNLINLKILNIGGTMIENNIIISLTNLTKLNINHNGTITNINNLINLKTLYAIYSWGIDNNSISSLTNLTNLNVKNNKKITDLNCLINLRILNIENTRGIDNIGISSLTNLIILNTDSNKKIDKINY